MADSIELSDNRMNVIETQSNSTESNNTETTIIRENNEIDNHLFNTLGDQYMNESYVEFDDNTSAYSFQFDVINNSWLNEYNSTISNSGNIINSNIITNNSIIDTEYNTNFSNITTSNNENSSYDISQNNNSILQSLTRTISRTISRTLSIRSIARTDSREETCTESQNDIDTEYNDISLNTFQDNSNSDLRNTINSSNNEIENSNYYDNYNSNILTNHSQTDDEEMNENNDLFSDMYAYRLQLEDDFLNETPIINRLKYYLYNRNIHVDDINQKIYAFYQYYNINIPLEFIVDVPCINITFSSALTNPVDLNNPLELISNLISTFTTIPAIEDTAMTDVVVSLNDDAIDNLQVTRANSSINDKCSVCLETFIENSEIIELQCSHIYHEKCIKEHLQFYSNKCPLCRIELGDPKYTNI